ncbi:hypothetical protein QAD02_024344 [Eretmocerus hayati]|uniref:Uncharacterized protein n=1 Tax=Eretmocerus hayati TaxID=131215 RepID=A0ACC2Q104_9HYME|nr:hypothetical protein QAD02_024344 [Eretmocerus hayati]
MCNSKSYEIDKQMYDGIESRLPRENKVIVHNVPESGNKHQLKNYLVNMLREAPFDPASTRYMRIGKKSADNEEIRLVKLILEDSGDAKWVLVHQKDFSIL